MKTIAIAAVALFTLLPTSAKASSVHEECLKAADYKGCIEVKSGNSNRASLPALVENLKNNLRLLPNRLENTNLRDFTSNTQAFNDAVASIDPSTLRSQYEHKLYTEAKAIQRMVQALQQYWSVRIHNGTHYGSHGSRSYNCFILRPALDAFNRTAIGGVDDVWQNAGYTVKYNGQTKKGGFLMPAMEECSPQETEMTEAISRRALKALEISSTIEQPSL